MLGSHLPFSLPRRVILLSLRLQRSMRFSPQIDTNMIRIALSYSYPVRPYQYLVTNRIQQANVMGLHMVIYIKYIRHIIWHIVFVVVISQDIG